MNSIRVASWCFVVAVLLAPLPALAQGSTANLNARVAALEAAVAALRAADTTLQTNINNEAAARQAADSTLQTNINTEAAAGAAADTALDVRVDKLEGNITVDDLVGDYAVSLLGMSMDPPGTVQTFNEMSSYAFTGTATLTANFRGSLNGTGVGRLMIEQAANLNWAADGGSLDIAGDFSWSYNNGVLTITPDPGAQFKDVALSVSLGGQVLVGANGGPPSNNQQLSVWTRK